MTAATVVDQIAQYFGGPYDPNRRSYRTPQLSVPGVVMGTVRRAKPKRWDNNDFYLGAVGQPIGCALMFFLTPGIESREGFGGETAGLKKVSHSIDLYCFVRSESPYAEDVQDALYGIQDAIRAHIHADRTCGSGGIEAGGFLVGESPPWIRWMDSEVESTAEKSQALVTARFSANEYIIA